MQNPVSSLAQMEYTHGECEDSRSAVSWPAIIAGAFVAIAVTLILASLGSGMGFAAAGALSRAKSPGASFTCMAAIWLIVVQWISSAFGAYITGRLRTKWARVHTHEVFFRDTAHGLLTWAVSTVSVAIVLLVATSSIVSGGAHVAAATAAQPSASMSAGNSASPSDYLFDSLFRADHPTAPVDADTKAETARILLKSVKDGGLSDADRTYLSQLVATHTGLTQDDAAKRVDEVSGQLHQNADDARKIAAKTAVFTFLSMLIGAFIACVAAALGGKQRDEQVYPAA